MKKQELSERAQTRFQEGWQRHQAQEFEAAASLFQQALTLYQRIGDSRNEQMVILALAATYGDWGKNDHAISYYQQVLSSMTAEPNNVLASVALTGLGMCYQAEKQFAEAIAYYEQGLELARKAHDRESEENLLMLLASCYHQLAAQLGDEALSPIVSASQDVHEDEEGIPRGVYHSRSASKLLEEGFKQLGQKDYAQALTILQGALAASVVDGDAEVEGRVLNTIAVIYHHLEHYPRRWISFNERRLLLMQAAIAWKKPLCCITSRPFTLIKATTLWHWIITTAP